MRARWRPTSGSALELIADLVRAPRLDEAELEREKLVILSELGECLDAPDDLIHDHLFEAAYRRPAAGAPGARPRADASTRSDARRLHGAGWPSNIAPSGWSSPPRARSIPGTSSCSPKRCSATSRRAAPPPIAPATFDGGIAPATGAPPSRPISPSPSPGSPAADPAAPALSLFAQAVGGGMSSRLFQELREERGLAYSIYAWTQGFAETGLFGVNLSTDKARAAEAMALARDCVARAAEDLSEAELKRARAQVEAGLLMSARNAAGPRRLRWPARSRFSAGS